jgi:hypothetical protein
MKKKIVGIFVCTLLIILSIVPAFKSDYNVSAKINAYERISEENIFTESSTEIKKMYQRLRDDYEKTSDIKESYEDRLYETINKITNIRNGNLDSYGTNDYDFMNSDYNADKLEFIMNNNKVCSLSSEYLIKGYVTDNSNYEPINEAHIIVIWPGDRYSIDRAFTYSNYEGFYSINVEFELYGPLWGGVRLITRADGYYSEVTDIEEFLENAQGSEELWFNVSLNPGSPPENSVICGYITDMDTDEPIENADVDFYQYEYGPGYTDWNYTLTDSSGYFSINVAAGEKSLFIHADDYYYNEFFSIGLDMGEYEVVWYNISFISRPPENSVIRGDITDELTGNPIENAIILLITFSHPFMFDLDWTITDSSGRYLINVPPGYPPYALYFSEGYFENYAIFYKKIVEYETVHMDITLYPYPQENSVVCGYVTDEITSDPVANAEINVFWNNFDHYYSNTTYTDSSGFYYMDVAAGEIRISYYDDDNRYFNWRSDNYNIGEYETISVDIALYPHPPENSIVCGYITDETTSDTISDARVWLSWKDDQNHYNYNSTYTDSSGFYLMNIAAGKFDLSAYVYRYFRVDTGYYNYDIGEYETFWVNMSMSPYPSENSAVYGYVKDSSNNEPFKYAMIELMWSDNDDSYWWNITFTDSSGLYIINVPKGEIQLSYHYAGFNTETVEYDIDDYETYWANVSLEIFKVQISRPQKGLYLNNTRLLPFFILPISTPIVLGNIDVEIDGPEPIDTVLFYINNKLKYEDHYKWELPFNWFWDEKAFGKYRVKAIALTNELLWNVAGDEITVWKFF